MPAPQYPPQLTAAVNEHPYPLLFATVSGAHLYGFPSQDSDWDLRGAHVLPLPEVLGLMKPKETVEIANVPDFDSMQMVPYGSDIELDLVTHDVRKFATMLLKRNGYVLEQLLSPLIVHTTPAHAELCSLAPRIITRHHAYHYLGFTANQWKLLEKDTQPRVKPLLYAFRTVLTGLHLMRTGQIEANLETLNTEAKLPYIDELIALKRNGKERETLLGQLDFYRAEHQRLVADLEEAKETTQLPSDVPQKVKQAVSNLVVQVRLDMGR